MALAILHARADTSIAAWLVELLARAMPDSSGFTALVDQGHRAPAQNGLRLSWRHLLPQVVHTIRMEDGIGFGAGLLAPHDISLDRLRAGLEAAEALEAAAST